MRSCSALWFCFLAASSGFALTGTVKNGKGAPVAGTTLFLVSAPSKTTSTNANGEFSLESGTAVQRNVSDPSHGLFRFELQGDRLLLSLGTQVDLGVVSLLSSDGKVFTITASSSLEAGVRSYPLPSTGAGVYLVRLGNSASSLAKLVRTGNDWFVASTSSQELGSADFAPRDAAALDTLVAQKAGYLPARIPISSYGQVVNVMLDSVSTVGRSAGCDKTATLANGTLSIQSGGKSRKYILRIPTDYDKSKSYRLVFAFAESGSSAQSVANRNYFRMAGYDSKGTIFVAPDAENGAGSWSKTDVVLTDDILAQVKNGLCIDTTRIFATGFSFGGAMSMALACTRADVFRGVAFFSGADLTGSCPTTLTKPIAYYASQASGDASGSPTPMSGRTKQAEFAKVNGCTAEPDAIVFPASGKAHTCTVYKNCSAGHPTVYCVFNGAHGWEPVDPGQSTSWDPPEAWKFITQF